MSTNPSPSLYPSLSSLDSPFSLSLSFSFADSVAFTATLGNVDDVLPFHVECVPIPHSAMICMDATLIATACIPATKMLQSLNSERDLLSLLDAAQAMAELDTAPPYRVRQRPVRITVPYLRLLPTALTRRIQEVHPWVANPTSALLLPHAARKKVSDAVLWRMAHGLAPAVKRTFLRCPPQCHGRESSTPLLEYRQVSRTALVSRSNLAARISRKYLAKRIKFDYSSAAEAEDVSDDSEDEAMLRAGEMVDDMMANSPSVARSLPHDT